MARVAADVGLSDVEISQFQKLLENPQHYLDGRSPRLSLSGGQDTNNKNFYKFLSSKDSLTSVPKKTFSTNNSTLMNNVLYSQFYNEMVEEYEGAKYNNADFETYIVESYLRRKNK